MNKVKWFFVLWGFVLLASGCATTRGKLDIRVDVPSNRSSDTAIKVTRVSDQRVFESRPDNPSIPSLKGGHIQDKAITSRAIARKRNSFGMAMGDIVLPENRTVEMVVREAVVRAFREAGYRTVDEKDSSSELILIEVDVDRFWAWMTPGFSTIDTNFMASVRIKGSLPALKDSSPIEGNSKRSGMAAGSRMWQDTIRLGIEDLVTNVKARLGK